MYIEKDPNDLTNGALQEKSHNLRCAQCYSYIHVYTMHFQTFNSFEKLADLC